ncbi:GntR family transcriptional regulator [Roseovarius nanhaiticus]|uniref:Transcriptional regulator, GntR family n=1 Tax=Roseovarius nanhaiticus TaxID=573024 RepID=A0A1N7FAE5_9RHOB|nr:GntR family transcriptional regulator [Roseovarius nanhaiticus]SEK58628.1 transcriptional regulator, GntR family [Roseovarius nanhaiticus]SIR97289.1 transcriptional regulator, GntR family [Roseovarius nanhaiticus]
MASAKPISDETSTTKSSALRTDLPPGQDAYQQIVSDIRAGNLLPGDRLTEVDLAARFGMSRTPVREAIRQLEADGLVMHTPRLGATIRTLDHSEISELYDMRAVLESTAARFAARAGSGVELSEIETIQAAMSAARSSEERYRQNQNFHAAILDAARNRFLLRAVQSVQKTLLILGRSTMEEPKRAEDAVREHAAIVTALRSRDEDEAERAMRLHIQGAHAARLRQLRDARPLDSDNHEL